MTQRNLKLTTPPMRGEDVAAWNRVIGVTGDVYGATSEQATRLWQRDHGLTPDGVVGPKTRAKLEAISVTTTAPEPFAAVKRETAVLPIKFVQAKHSRWASRAVPEIKWIVMHSAETSERANTAESLGAYFADPKQMRDGKLVPVTASAHYSVDNDSIVQHVRDAHIAFHVRAPGINAQSIGIELAGRAAQTREQWLDDYGVAMLRLAGRLVRSLCETWRIPIARVDAAGLLAGERGITGHVDVRDAWRTDTHWDPGKSFPYDVFLDYVRRSG